MDQIISSVDFKDVPEEKKMMLEKAFEEAYKDDEYIGPSVSSTRLMLDYSKE